MTKTLNQIIFFFLHQNQNIFCSNLGNQNIFRWRNSTRRRISNTVLQPRYWGREADSPEVCRLPPHPQKIVFQKDAKWSILLHFGYKTCSVKSLNIVWKNHEKMEISILHIYKSNLGPSNSDGSNTMDGSNLFESPANFPYIFKLKKIFRSNTDTSNSRT